MFSRAMKGILALGVMMALVTFVVMGMAIRRQDAPMSSIAKTGKSVRHSAQSDQLGNLVVPHEDAPPETSTPFSESDLHTLTARAERSGARFDLDELRRAVVSGNVNWVRVLGGYLEPEDAAAIYSMILEISEGTQDDSRSEIKSTLLRLLHRTPGDAAAGYLLSMVRQEGFLDPEAWRATLWSLGQHRFREAAGFVEGYAFPARNLLADRECQRRVYVAAGALMLIDPERYLLRVSQEVRSGGESELWAYVAALQTVSDQGTDIGSVVPDLQSRYRALSPDQGGNRTWILKVLESDAKVRKSDATRKWLIAELENVIANISIGTGDKGNLPFYQDMLQRLRDASQK